MRLGCLVTGLFFTLAAVVAFGFISGVLPFDQVAARAAALLPQRNAGPDIKLEEVSLMLTELNREKEWIRAEQARLKQWEEELAARELELKERPKEEKQDAQVDKERVWFSSMQPWRAAEILSKLTPDQIADILLSLDDRTAARILEAMEPELAAKVSELLFSE